MILCDIGNTNLHLYRDGVVENITADSFEPELFKERVYYISVNNQLNRKLSELENWINLDGCFELKGSYKTMGIDRKAACYGVENGVIIDAGSAITVDVMRNGYYEGGFITAGVTSMARAYRDISLNLEHSFNFEVPLDKLPKTTQDSVTYGYLGSFALAVNKFAPSLPIVCTGGDAKKIAKLFEKSRVDEILLFKHMREIIKDNPC